MKITKAVIACGGWSTRFLPTVKSYAKHLVPILEKPQVQYVLEEMVAAGITDIAIIHRHGEKTIRQYWQKDPELTEFLRLSGKQSLMESWEYLHSKIKNIKFIPQSRRLLYGNGVPIICAKSFIGNDPFVYAYGDDLVIEEKTGNFLSTMIETFNRHQASAVFADQIVPPETVPKVGIVKLKQNSPIEDQVEYLIEKPKLEDAPSNHGIVSPFVLSPKIIPTLQKTAIARGELWLTDAINLLAQTDIVIAQSMDKAKCQWMTTGDPINWLKVNLLFAFKNEKYKDEMKKFIASLS